MRPANGAWQAAGAIGKGLAVPLAVLGALAAPAVCSCRGCIYFFIIVKSSCVIMPSSPELSYHAPASSVPDTAALLQLMGVATTTAAGLAVEGTEASAGAAAEGAVGRGIEVRLLRCRLCNDHAMLSCLCDDARAKLPGCSASSLT